MFLLLEKDLIKLLEKDICVNKRQNVLSDIWNKHLYLSRIYVYSIGLLTVLLKIYS